MISINRKKKISDVAGKRQVGVVVLEDVHDPHNAAAVLRTCDAFGIQNVNFIFEQEKPYNPKKVGKASSSSANKWLDFVVYKSTEKCFKDLKKQGYKIFVTALTDKSVSLLKTKLNKMSKVALVFGNEHRGVSAKALNLADEVVSIPMQGFVQSLNISVTAAVVLFELFRQRKSKTTNFLLSEKDKKKLISNWCKK